MLTYPLFIDELRTLRADIDKLRQEPGLSESVPFRTWRHALSTLLDQMRRNGYPHINCNVQLRSFQPGPWSTVHPANHFHEALHDTVIELDNLISSYDKYGDPKPPAAVAASSTPAALPAPQPAVAALPKPGEITWAWVRTNVPFAYWTLAVGIVVTVATLGFGAGQMYQGFMAKVDGPRGGTSGAIEHQQTTKQATPVQTGPNKRPEGSSPKS